MKKPAKRKVKQAKSTLFVAVVCKAAENRSQRTEGDWSSFIHSDRKEAISAAMKARAKWEASGKFGPYDILVGELVQQVRVPVTFELTKIDAAPKKSTVMAMFNRSLIDVYTPAIKEHLNSLA